MASALTFFQHVTRDWSWMMEGMVVSMLGFMFMLMLVVMGMGMLEDEVVVVVRLWRLLSLLGETMAFICMDS